MFRARPPFFGMKAGCFMLQSRAGGSSALRAPPPHRCCVLRLRVHSGGAPSPLLSPHPHLSGSPQGARGARSRRGGAGPSGGGGHHRAGAAQRRAPGAGPSSRCPPHPTPSKALPVRGRVASTVDHGDPCPQNSQLVDGQTAVSTPCQAVTRHQREGLSRSWGPPGLFLEEAGEYR